MAQDHHLPEISGPEARLFFPQVILRTRHRLESLGLPRETFPEGQGPYQHRLDAADAFIPAALRFRLALFQSAPHEIRFRAEHDCQVHLRPLQQVLWPMVAECHFGQRHYRRGQREWVASEQAVQAALLECLCCPVQLARVVLEMPAEQLTDVAAFFNYLIQMALSDSLGYQGREDRYRDHETLPEPELWNQWSQELAGTAEEPEERDFPSMGDIAGLLLKHFVKQFPVVGVPLEAERATEAQQLYLEGMLLCADQSPRSGWGHQRFPRGYLTQTVAPALGLPVHQERLLRRAFEVALKEVRALRMSFPAAGKGI